MKTLFALIVTSCLVYSQNAQAEQQPTHAREKATFIQVWGFLKYYHPSVADGSRDWDAEFMQRVKGLPEFSSIDERSAYYAEWLDELGEVKPCKKCKKEVPDSLAFNLNQGWQSDAAVFSDELIARLIYLRENRFQAKHKYVSYDGLAMNPKFKNEKVYADSIFPSPQMRMLSLARYWNIVEYFYPYKYVIDENWDDVLTEFVPRFKLAADTLEYHLAMKELVVRINDSHAELQTDYLKRFYGGGKAQPFKFKMIEGKAVVTGFYLDSICAVHDIRKGDVFLTVDGKAIEEVIGERWQYINGSNDAVKLRNTRFSLFTGAEDSVLTTYERNGHVHERYIPLCHVSDFDRINHSSLGLWKVLEGNIGYVDLADLKRDECDEVLEKVKGCDAIVFDVRNYPRGTVFQIMGFLNAEKRPFVKFTFLDASYPGVFQYARTMKCGKKNKKNYKGKVVVLFNEDSQSHAEFTVMALQTADNVTCIGSQTSGADGNVSLVTLPGNITTYITGLGIYYPDGRETQRIGMVPDIEVRPTIQGIKEGRDEVLEAALEYLNAPAKP